MQQEKIVRDRFPFNVLPFLTDEFAISFARPITIFVGENGSGKSTLLEAIALAAGFHPQGGSADHQTYAERGATDGLSQALRCAWLPKVNNGFFFRAESFFNIANYIDTVGDVDRSGGRHLHQQSHGESFLALFRYRMADRRNALYLLDEPEAALSPSRQVEFVRVMRDWERAGNVQAVIVTHAPMLMAYPGATLVDFTRGAMREVRFEDTEHFRLMQAFFQHPQNYLKAILQSE